MKPTTELGRRNVELLATQIARCAPLDREVALLELASVFAAGQRFCFPDMVETRAQALATEMVAQVRAAIIGLEDADG